ncbi:large ribosomal subunit protein uL10m-like [Planococcus citri]|uniref:large ribosomal subunit protein uL10m-like n=1 Tax=Planococcus citri TaxID=170843 RepID=UPI0031F7D105
MFAGFCKNHSLKTHAVLFQSVRYKRVNLRKPRPPHFEAQRIEKFVRVSIPKPYDADFPQFLKCRKPLKSIVAEKEEENPYERILANELLELFEKSKMIMFLHANPVCGEDFYRSIKTFKKADMELVQRSKTTVKMAVENSKYLPITSLFHSHTVTLCSAAVQIDVAFKLLKKMPYYILLGGIVNDQFLHRNKLEEYSKLPNLDVVRGQLVHTLNAGSAALANNILNHHQNDFVSLLDRLPPKS